ncbi:MAG: sulfate transporter family protein [Devosiaceae bacterium]|nr:sulfate transporter family protein [Devosiaceae bacterium MH13]
MLSLITQAAKDVLSPPFRGVLFKSLGITLLALVAAWFGLEALIDHLVQIEMGWLDGLVQVLSGFALVVGAVVLIVPITALVASLFLDDIASIVEGTHYPRDPAGRSLQTLQALREAVGFFFVVIVVNLAALTLLLVPGINAIIFLLANGYLLGREYFELAALRHRPKAEVRALRRANGGRVFLAGLVIAGFVAIPIVNLLTPLFATALMVHLHKQLAARGTPQGAAA